MNVSKTRLNIGGLFVILLFILVPAYTQADAESQARDIIDKATAKSGKSAWDGMATLLVHESQARNTDTGKLQMELIHTMDTKGRGYRMEISSSKGKQIYGWDGKQFWAVVDGKPGDAAQVKEAKRLISDAFYRFSLPFVLNDRNAQMEYAGKDSVNGVETDSVKITYKGGPVDSYWNTGESRHQPDHADVKHDTKAAVHADHMGEKHADTGGEVHAKNDEAAGDHHSGNQVYFYHFDKDHHIVKIYFSHHGDDSYETFLFDNFTTIDGITREQSRTLIREDGNTLYDTKFTRVEFRNDADVSVYKSPHH